MEIMRFSDAQAYEAPRHHNMTALRLQGAGASSLQGATVGFSRFTPGGGADLSASSSDRVYVVLSGEILVEAGGLSATLGANDSCFIAAKEERRVENVSNDDVTMVVITIAR